MSQILTVNNVEVKCMNLNVPIELHNAFKSTTAAAGQNMTDVLLEFIRDYLAKHSAKKGGASENALLFTSGSRASMSTPRPSYSICGRWLRNVVKKSSTSTPTGSAA